MNHDWRTVLAVFGWFAGMALLIGVIYAYRVGVL